jgi:hypothetical protein
MPQRQTKITLLISYIQNNNGTGPETNQILVLKKHCMMRMKFNS